jgi:hypothetical protein
MDHTTLKRRPTQWVPWLPVDCGDGVGIGPCANFAELGSELQYISTDQHCIVLARCASDATRNEFFPWVDVTCSIHCSASAAECCSRRTQPFNVTTFPILIPATGRTSDFERTVFIALPDTSHRYICT